MPNLGPLELGIMLLLIVLPPLWLVSWLVVRRLRMPSCPHCAERIKRKATVCRYCGRSVATDHAQPER